MQGKQHQPKAYIYGKYFTNKIIFEVKPVFLQLENEMNSVMERFDAILTFSWSCRKGFIDNLS